MGSSAQAFPPITDRPEDILSAWTALEVLSPLAFKEGEHDLLPLSDPLPWTRRPKLEKGKRLVYQVVLGTINMRVAIKRLLAVHVDRRMEPPHVSGEAILAVVALDQDGLPVADEPVQISSFGWGAPVALNGDLAGLAAWPEVEPTLKASLLDKITQRDENGRPLPLTRAALDAAHAWLVDELGLPDDTVHPPRFAIRKEISVKSGDLEPLLNSFFLGDLARARALFAAGTAPEALKRYLGVLKPGRRPDLLDDTLALERAVRPPLYSPARWPGHGRHSLVLLQQAAVNLARTLTGSSGVLAVNGPPGTGKTTLLRDLVADLVAARAEAMLDFDDPEEAFEATGLMLKAGNGVLKLHRLDPRLKGFEMLVASSNNSAVENVSTELPSARAVAEDVEDLRYFRSLAEGLHGGDCWGLGAAVLGKSENRRHFREGFWWHSELGLKTYLAAATGEPDTIDDPKQGARAPRIVDEEDAPAGRGEALARWRAARKAFQAALTASRDALAELESVRVAIEVLPRLADALDAVAAAACRRPRFWSRLFRTRAYRAWRAEADAAHVALASSHEAARPALESDLDAQLARVVQGPFPIPAELALVLETTRRVIEAVRRRREAIGDSFVDEAFFARDHRTRQLNAPWMDSGNQRLRDDVFVAAMALHKAFIDAAAKPLKHNLALMMNVLTRPSLGDPTKNALIPDLWSSLFLVTPALSTTFASVDRMLRDMPPESLGWLLIDEAGQATPQEAVGALLRSRRAVIVGDPIQIPPVVTLCDTLTVTIHRRFGVDPDRFDAPAASVQTLADAATPYCATFPGDVGERVVGVPLLVHRRCAEPMFSIANRVAYAGMMVTAKTPAASPIAEVLGPSSWIDIQSAPTDKWSPEEGHKVIDMLARLIVAKTKLDLYIVTPFRLVAESLRRAIVTSGVLGVPAEEAWIWVKTRVGTVHTVQGREAEAVIFVLGAPSAQHQGARTWAGGQPNLLNVAVTRAKETLYVVGHRQHWSTAGVFRVLADKLQLPSSST